MIRKNKWLAIVVIMVLVLFLIASVAGARGPANKATGSVWISHSTHPDSYLVFDAHAESPHGRRAAKGTLYWYWDVEGKSLEQVLEMDPFIVVDITHVYVEGSTARFAGPRPDRADWVVFQVFDGGSPGAGNDTIPLQNLGEAAAINFVEIGGNISHNWTIYGGNLVVHYYE